MIFDLAEDFSASLDALPQGHPKRRLLRLLDEAVRRDIHFVDRHPTTLFQCLWNTCWWYDCPEAGEHYEESEGGGADAVENKPLSQAPIGLSRSMEVWRTKKQELTPGFFWARMLRPPGLPLGSAQRMVLRGHLLPVQCVAWAPSGQLLVSSQATDDRGGGLEETAASICIWDAATGREVNRLHGHQDGVRCVACLPDGRRIVSGSYDKTVRMWDACTGQEVLRFPPGDGAALSLAVSPDGRRLATGSASEVSLWDIHRSSSEPLWHADVPDRDVVWAVAYHPNGRLVAGGTHHGVRVWNADTGAEVLHCKVWGVYAVAWRPTEPWLLAGCSDGTVSILDGETGEELRSLATGVRCAVKCVSCSPDGRLIVAGTGNSMYTTDGAIHVWDAKSGAELTRFRGHAGGIWSVACSPDGSLLASAGDDKTVRVWDLTARKEQRSLRRHPGRIASVSFSPREQWLTSRSVDGTSLVWDARTGRFHAKGATPRGFDHERDRMAGFIYMDVLHRYVETSLAIGKTGDNVTWLPVLPVCVEHSEDRRTWGIAEGNSLYIARLEGGVEGIVARRAPWTRTLWLRIRRWLSRIRYGFLSIRRPRLGP